MKNFLLRLFDSTDREVEAHLVLLCCGAFALIGLSIYHVVILRHMFDATGYGQGLGCLLVGNGVAAWGQGLQRKNEDKNEPDQ